MGPERIDETLPARLEKAFANLPRKHQEIILLARVEGLTYLEMGIRLGLDVEQVERRVALAIAALDRMLERQQRPWWHFW
jgi:RNA polymerase sigma factor (sigma-70 family)